MIEFIVEVEVNVKFRLIEFCLVFIYCFFVYVILLRMY